MLRRKKLTEVTNFKINPKFLRQLAGAFESMSKLGDGSATKWLLATTTISLAKLLITMATTYFASSQVKPAVLQSDAGGGPTSTKKYRK